MANNETTATHEAVFNGSDARSFIETDAEETAVLELELPAPPQAFAVHDAEAAAWLVRRVTEARAYGQKVKA